MLIELNISNIALIESLRIEFAEGFNVVTGETGSGKSIIVDCMNLVLGGRADRALIRTGSERGYVQALFDVANNTAAKSFLNEQGVDHSDDSIVISREISRSGRNICRVNGMMLPLAALRQLSAMLLDIHGQHEHQTLMRPGTHIHFLDAFGGTESKALRLRVESLYQERSALAKDMKRLMADLRERERLADMLRFQAEEIEAAHLKAGEEERLQNKLQVLSNAERIHDSVERAYRLTYQGTGKGESAQEALKSASAEMERIASFSPKYQELAQRLQELFYAAQDVGYELQDALDRLPSDPALEQKLSDRLSLIDKLERKYGATVEEVISFGEEARRQLNVIETGDLQLTSMREQLDRLDGELVQACQALTARREMLAETLAEAVMAQLMDLGMGNTRFEARLIPEPKPTANGNERVEFMISPNPGEPLRPLAEIASGGELSRIMLALKAISMDMDSVPSMVFDEIDTGVSGRMAQVVGEKMCMIAANHQVLCVTHLPQIAALGAEQYLVQKNVDHERTETTVRRLDRSGRILELSRLVGGAHDSESSLSHAEHMLKAAEETRVHLEKAYGN